MIGGTSLQLELQPKPTPQPSGAKASDTKHKVREPDRDEGRLFVHDLKEDQHFAVLYLEN